MRRDLAEVRAFWDGHINNAIYVGGRVDAGSFEEIQRRRYRYHFHLRELFSRLAGERPCGVRALEIGCGIGIDAESLARCGFREVVAVDLSPPALALALARRARTGLPIRYATGNAEALPFPDGAFDFVYSFGVLHHTPDMPRAVAEAVRVLRPGGRFVGMLYAKVSLVNLLHWVFRIPYESPRHVRDHCPVVYRLTSRRIRALFGGGMSLRLRKTYPFTYGLRPLHAICPLPVQRALGGVIGWHWMIEGTKG